jgi:hypothetical protein
MAMNIAISFSFSACNGYDQEIKNNNMPILP